MIVLDIGEGSYFVLRRRLPRQAKRVRRPIFAAICRPTIEVRGEERCALGLVVIHVRQLQPVDEVSNPREEPETVLHDRTPQRSTGIPDGKNFVRRRKTAGTQLVGHVVALQTVIAEQTGEASSEDVATLLGNGV